MSIIEELKRRNVFRVAIAYILIAWLLLQGLDFGLDLIGAPNWVIQALFLLAAVGLPGVVVFAWVFEMTPEGLKRESEIDRSQSITPQTGRKLDRVIIVVLTLAVGYLMVDRLYLQRAPVQVGTEATSPAAASGAQQAAAPPTTPEPAAPAKPSIAVLPFVNMSNDPDNEYFSDGLTETLLNMLAQLPGLQVAARTSSFAFKGQNKSIPEIAEALGVANVLEGSVQKAGDRVRVTAQLIRAADGFHVWSQNYTRPLEDIFAIQDEIATDVATALDESLLGGGAAVQGVATANVDAYDLYLKAMEQQAIFSFGSLEEAESLFKQALAADPGFIDAKLGLARNYLKKSGTGLIDPATAESAMRPLLEQVRAKQPDNHHARALEIVAMLQSPSSVLDRAAWDAGLAELRDLLPLIPTETYVRWRLALTLAFARNQPDAALEVVEAGMLVDPLSSDLYSARGGILRLQERLPEAKAALQRALELDPRNPNRYGQMADLAGQMNDIRGKLDWTRRAIEVDPQDHELAGELAQYLYHLDLPEEGDRWAARVAALAPGSDVARRVELQRAYARHETAHALNLAKKMVEDQVSMRQDAFPTAVFDYLDLMMRAGRNQEALNFLFGLRPELKDFSQMPKDVQGLVMQFAAVELMTGVRPPEERKDAWLKLSHNFDALGFPWRDKQNPGNRMVDALFTGKTDEAISIALDAFLSDPVAQHLTRGKQMELPMFADVTADPRVAARLAEWNREYQQDRKQVSEMLQQPEWQQ